MLLLFLNKQDMKDQMSNSSMQALAERKNRQVRTRNGQCISVAMYILSGVPPLTDLWCGKGLTSCSQAVFELCPFGCPGRAGSHRHIAASLSQASQSFKSAFTICVCLQSWLFTTVSVAPSRGKGNLPPPRGGPAQNPCQ